PLELSGSLSRMVITLPAGITIGWGAWACCPVPEALPPAAPPLGAPAWPPGAALPPAAELSGEFEGAAALLPQPREKNSASNTTIESKRTGFTKPPILASNLGIFPVVPEPRGPGNAPNLVGISQCRRLQGWAFGSEAPTGAIENSPAGTAGSAPETVTESRQG